MKKPKKRLHANSAQPENQFLAPPPDPRGACSTPTHHGRSSGSPHQGLPPSQGFVYSTSSVALGSPLSTETHSNGLAQDSHLLPFSPPFNGTMTAQNYKLFHKTMRRLPLEN
jgi:hypothetical protein